MLLNAFLACGARHLNLVNPVYEDAKAREYYSTSSNLLLKQMQNPYRDTVIVATTAVILNVYEIMTERALQRMNHIAGARALIKECGWNAKTHGIGNACFWLNVGMELLSCLHFNWQVAWNPDDWGVDMDFQTAQEAGREEIWTHRMVWIVAHIANFRASLIVRPGDPPQDHVRIQSRFDEWRRWKDWLEAWEASVPRSRERRPWTTALAWNGRGRLRSVIRSPSRKGAWRLGQAVGRPTQLRKLADGILSGRYSKPDSNVIAQPDNPEVPHQKGLNPAMF